MTLGIVHEPCDRCAKFGPSPTCFLCGGSGTSIRVGEPAFDGRGGPSADPANSVTETPAEPAVCGMCQGTKIQEMRGVAGMTGRPVHLPCPYCRGTGLAHALKPDPNQPVPREQPAPLEYYGPPAPPRLLIDETAEPCSCTSCVRACETRPGWFLPGEAEKAAELLGLTLQELFDKHLSVEWWEDMRGCESSFVLAPAIAGNHDEGGMASYDPKGRCGFLKDGRCSIHEAKPFECRAYVHTDTKDIVKERHKAVAWAWFKPEHQEQLRELNGYLYVPDRPSGYGFWSF